MANIGATTAFYKVETSLTKANQEVSKSMPDSETLRAQLGSAFSLDGVHLSPRGNAIIANYVIDVINRNFGSTLQKVDPASFRTVTLK